MSSENEVEQRNFGHAAEPPPSGGVHIAGGGKREVYPEDQVAEVWRQGFIPVDALYWKPGMMDWRPVSEYFIGIPREEAPREPRIEKLRYTFEKDPTELTRFAVTMLWLSLALAAIEPVARLSEQTVRILASVELVITISTAVAFLTWVYWAYRNTRYFGAEGLRFTPGWAVGYYFIPIIWLFRPYQVMREIWQVSDDPKNWQAARVDPVVKWWWGIWLVGGFVGTLATALTVRAQLEPKLPEFAEWGAAFNYVALMLHVADCILAMRMLTAICRRQQQLVEDNS